MLAKKELLPLPKTYPALSFYEIGLYFLIWTGGISYCLYKVYLAGNNYKPYLFEEDFVPGWTFINRDIDRADYEWTAWLPFAVAVAPWIVTHFFVAEIIHKYKKEFLQSWYLCVSTIFTVYHFGLIAVPILWLQPLLVCAALSLRCSKTIVWLLIGFLIIINNFQPLSYVRRYFEYSEDWDYILSITLAWTQLRAVSFFFYKADLKKSSPQDCKTVCASLMALLSYCFYLPATFFGPLIPYDAFVNGILQNPKEWKAGQILTTVLQLLRFLWWLIVNELFIHYIYVSALQFQPKVLSFFDSWAFYGLGYCMGQFFMTKYTVMYGIPAVIARAEQISAPDHPKCISRIHLYSDMWRYFDRGLYLFLTRYIKAAWCGQRTDFKNELFASFLCFLFVYLWHGKMLRILIWASLNFLGITIESIARRISATSAYRNWEMKHMDSRWRRRFYAAIASPLFMMSALSCFYFFAGVEVGNMFVRRVLQGFWQKSTWVLLFFLYCGSHVSMEVKNWEYKRTKKIS